MPIPFLPADLRSEIREILRLAVPLASAQVAQSATGFVDTIMMGRLGANQLAAGGLASLTFFTLLAAASGAVMGASPLVAEAFGAGQRSRVEQVTRQGFWLTLVLTIPMMAIIGHWEPLMQWTGQSPQTIKLATSYLNVILWGFFPALGFAMLRGVVAGLSQAKPVMTIVVTGTVLNIIGNYVLGFGKFGFPRLELAGLAISSTVSLWFMFLALVVYTMRHKHLKQYRFYQNLQYLQPRLFGQLVYIGLPIGVSSAFEAGLFTTVTYLMGALGTQVLAAHQIVLQTVFVIFMVPLGVSFAITARVGQLQGQQNYAAARRSGFLSIGLSSAFMIFMTILLLLFPRQVIGIYIDLQDPMNTEVIAIALPILFIASVIQVLDGLQKTALGGLYGIQDTRVPMLLNIMSYWIIGLPIGYLLGFKLNMSGPGLWIGQSIGVAIAAIIFIWRFHKLTSRKHQLKLNPEPIN
jgi:multidrug resistance protein, MATE family